MSIDRNQILPHLHGEGCRLFLKKTSGRTLSVEEFIGEHLYILAENEIKVIKQNKGLPLPNGIPALFSTPLKRDRGTENSSISAIIPAMRAGSRSAYIYEQKYHLKGCNPKPDVEFPLEELPFGSEKLLHDKTIFGCLTAENVMREILAFYFLNQTSLPLAGAPVCVFEYHHSGHPFGYCLVSERPVNDRTEDLLDFYDLTIRDLIYLKFMENKFNVRILEKDVQYSGLDDKWYVREKARQLVIMNINGGFRGILNSNLGNDILVSDNRFALCDFDTFKVIDVPEDPSSEFIKSFCLWCLAELIKTSPMVWDYIDLEECDKKESARFLADSYFSNSRLWKEYEWQFLEAVTHKGWNHIMLSSALKSAVQSDVCQDLLLDVVLNSKVLRESYAPEESLYIGHK